MGEDFLRAAQQGDVGIIDTCLEKNNDTSKCLTYCHKRSGDTAAHLAARHGHVNVLKTLRSFGDRFINENLDGKRPLHEAALSGQLDCVQYLLSNDVEVDPLKRADWTPVMLACTKHNLDIVQELVRHGANVTLKNKDGWNSFHIAAREGNVDILNYLLDQKKDIWNTVSKNQRTPLHTAALHGKLEAVQLFLERCDFNVDDLDTCGTTPLMDTIRAGFTNVAKLLITKHKADYERCDVIGRQPVHLASQAGAVESIDMLVKDCGVSVDTMTTKTDLTPLHLAAKEGQYCAIQCLLCHAANVNLADLKGRRALHMAVGGQHTDCVKLLLQHGAVDSADNSDTKPSDLTNKPAILQLFSLLKDDTAKT